MSVYTNTNKKILVLFLFISFFLIGFSIYSDFGIGVDEDNSRINGFVSLRYIYEIFLPENLFSIDSIINVPNINEYNEQGNGVVFDVPLAFAEIIFDINDIRNIYLIRHFFNFLIFFVSVFFFYKIIKYRYNSYFIAILGVLFLIGSPRIFAESFYNTKDIFFMSLFIISLYSAILFLDKPNLKTLTIFVIMSALTTDVRILAIFLPFLIFLIYLINILRQNIFKRKEILLLAYFLFTIPFFTYLFWPYLWADPFSNFIDVFKNLSNHPVQIYNFYLGNFVNAENVPWHYPLIWISITTPIFYLFLFIVGFVFILYRAVKRLLKIEKNNSYTDLWRGNNELYDLIFLLVFLIPLLAIIDLNSSIYDGWRHLYFIYPSFLLVSISGLQRIKNIFFKKRIVLINYVSFLLILPTFFWIYSNHPFQNNYFNAFAGKKFNESFDMDYWGISNKYALDLIAKKENKIIKVASLNTSDLGLSKKMLSKIKRKLIRVTSNFSDANYIINNYRDWNGKINPLSYEVPSNFKVFYEIKVDDVVINTIYKRK